jgi:hypothetical protein
MFVWDAVDFIVSATSVESREEALKIAQLDPNVVGREIDALLADLDPDGQRRVRELESRIGEVPATDRMDAFSRFSQLETELENLEEPVYATASEIDHAIRCRSTRRGASRHDRLPGVGEFIFGMGRRASSSEPASTPRSPRSCYGTRQARRRWRSAARSARPNSARPLTCCSRPSRLRVTLRVTAASGRSEPESGSGGRTRTYDQAVNSRPLYH